MTEGPWLTVTEVAVVHGENRRLVATTARMRLAGLAPHLHRAIPHPQDRQGATRGCNDLGDIQVVTFEDASTFGSCSGHVSTTSSVTGGGGGTVDVTIPISHSFFLAASTGEQTAVLKVLAGDGVRVRYKVNTALAVPSFKATIDIDGNFANNTDASYSLTLRP